jgi:hypothetical protein
MQASTSDNPMRQALSGLASGIYKATASFQTVDPSLSPLWQGLKKLNLGEVQAALRNGADPNETSSQGDPSKRLCLACITMDLTQLQLNQVSDSPVYKHSVYQTSCNCSAGVGLLCGQLIHVSVVLLPCRRHPLAVHCARG